MIGIAAGLTIGGKIPLQEHLLTSLQEGYMTKFVNQ
jgi:transketolase C-terminal domain/subunit